MPITIEFDLTDGPALAAFASYVGKWVGADPKRASAFPGAQGLLDELNDVLKEISTSSVYVNDRTVSEEIAKAWVYLGHLFLRWVSEDDGRIVGAYVAQLAGQVDISACVEKEVGRNPLLAGPKLASRIFLSCGRDFHQALLLERWLKKFPGVDVVLLESESTISSPRPPEALEEAIAAGCGTAIVLATAEDKGRLAGTKLTEDRPRARQNVILELGLLWGLLGRRRVILLMDERLIEAFPTEAASFMTLRFHGEIKTAFDALHAKLQEIGVVGLEVK